MEEKRKHFRVDAKMPIGSRLLPPDEAIRAQSRLGSKTSHRDFPPLPRVGIPA